MELPHCLHNIQSKEVSKPKAILHSESQRDCLQHTCMPSAGLCFPHLEPSCKTGDVPAGGVQRRAVRWAASDYYYRSSVTVVLQDLGWWVLLQAQVCTYFAGIFVDLWQCGCRFACGDLVDYPGAATHWPSPRFMQPGFYYKYSFYPLAIARWSALPQSVVCLPAVGLFRLEGLVDCCTPGPGSGVVVFGLVFLSFSFSIYCQTLIEYYR